MLILFQLYIFKMQMFTEDEGEVLVREQSAEIARLLPHGFLGPVEPPSFPGMFYPSFHSTKGHHCHSEDNNFCRRLGSSGFQGVATPSARDLDAEEDAPDDAPEKANCPDNKLCYAIDKDNGMVRERKRK